MPPGWREQYDRMKRWHARLIESKSFEPRDIDDFYAFFTCCFHLKDWLEADSALDRSIGPEAEALIDGSDALRICADTANGAKHLVMNRRVRLSANVRVERLLADFDPQQADPENEMIIVHADGMGWPARGIARHCVEEWEAFLRDRGLLPTNANE